ncbi:hypothetical protein CLOM_g23662 [Closterium sp. NIES-68]|nr:hypothetical protein CLOM_g23662 [Closterium sp. NIES-68]GJP86882.1 hypothetical protein CLOP_g16855 [Closterium sp. NIES-67]
MCKFHRDLPATKQYAYGTSQKTASYPGPTIVAKVGVDTTVTWENHLLDNTHMFTVDPTLIMGYKWPKKGIPIVVHRHGGSQQSYYDGHAYAWITQYGEKGPTYTSNAYKYIATDGGYMAKPVYSKSLLLVPGARQDVLVDFSNLPATCKDVILQNVAAAPFPAGVIADRDTGLVMRFVMTNRKRFPAPKLPSTISYIPVINFKNIQKVRWHRLVEAMDPKTNLPVRVTIDNLGFADPVTDFPKQGTNELWHIINLSADAHPMHWHLVDHRPVARRPFDVAGFQAGTCSFRDKKKPTCFTGPGILVDPTEDGWKDTTPAYPGQVLTLWFGWHDGNGKPLPFDPTVGPGYMYHCHMLDHEDNDMMRPFKVIK